jgi:hypothetical protein
MPWNAAFATVLVATFVTVLWQRDPIPGAGTTGDTQMKASAPRASEPKSPEQSGSAAPVASVAPIAPVAPELPVPALVAPEIAPPAAPAAPAAPPPRAEAKRQQAPQATQPQIPPAAPREDQATAAKERRSQPASPPSPSVAAVPPPPVFAAPVAPQADAVNRLASPDPLAARARKLEEESMARRSEFAARAPAAAAPSGAIAPAPSVRTEATEPPTFAALAQWNRITITQRGGETRSLSRPEARDLNALLGSAALSAVGPQPLAATPEWRITLERNGETLAVFELARGQVRWREGRAPPATGAPSAPALAALRDALRDAVQQPKPENAQPPEATRPPEGPRTP